MQSDCCREVGRRLSIPSRGHGPMDVQEWLADHTTLVPNPNYWGGKPKISELVSKPVPEPSARVIMLENGKPTSLIP